MEPEEYRRMAAVEDEMWFYRALHSHLERELERAFSAMGRRASLAGMGSGADGDDRERFRILDAGCGTGGLIRRLTPRHPDWQWTGIDVEPLACHLARARCTGEILEGSVTALPFADASFDAVVSSDVLYHLDDDNGALRECWRVLRPGGSLVINVPAHRWLWSYHDVTVHGRRRYEKGGIAVKLREAGFAAVRSTHWNTLPLPLIVLRRKCFSPPPGGSDVRLYPALIEWLLRMAMAVERVGLRVVGSFPIGSSLLAVAMKPRAPGEN